MISIVPFSIALSLTLQSALRSTASTYHPRSAQGGRHRTLTALACLETLVHLNAGGLPLNRYLVSVTIPDSVWAAARTETPGRLPVGWDADPAGRASIQFGSAWIRSGSSALLRVPSVIVPDEYNVLINPLHPDSGGIIASKIRKWLYDPRLTKAA
jgi:RES domain-containing protein